MTYVRVSLVSINATSKIHLRLLSTPESIIVENKPECLEFDDSFSEKEIFSALSEISKKFYPGAKIINGGYETLVVTTNDAIKESVVSIIGRYCNEIAERKMIPPPMFGAF